jgi:hypothetical protein
MAINKSILNRNNFKFLIEKVPNVEYYVKSVNIPGIQFTETVAAAGVGLDAFFPGDKVSFDTLDVSFLVDEDLENFKEIYNWINDIVPVHDPEDYKNLTGTSKTITNIYTGASDDLAKTSQITLVLNTNKNIPNRFLRFYDAFPISLSAVELESGADGEPAICQVSFRFTYYDIATSS